MANYYNQFSESIENISPEEEAWIRKNLDTSTYEDEEPSWGSGETYQLYFEWEIIAVNGARRDLLIYSERGDEGEGDLDQVADFVSAFLCKFRPEKHFFLNYACCCSSPVTGGFSGGTLEITANVSE